MGDIRLLDCTLRDGGFYTRWDFEPLLVTTAIRALDAAGIEIIEVGYRSAQRTDEGIFKTCDEAQLGTLLPELQRATYAFMIDAKDVKSLAALGRIVPAARDSLFRWARVATHLETLDHACAIAGWLRDRGYLVAVNIMGVSADLAPRLAMLLAEVNRCELDALVLADSFGSLTPQTTAEVVRCVRLVYRGVLGLHLHDNLGLALANALVGIEHGVEMIDCTLAGMGRGAGNVRTEEMLAALARDPSPLVATLVDHMEPLHARYRWDTDDAYRFAAHAGIHPMYCQELRARRSVDDTVAILHELTVTKRARFDANELHDAELRHACQLRLVAGNSR